MSDHDFFDEDLIKQRDSVKRIKMGPADQPAARADVDPPASGTVSDLNLTRMVQRRDDLSEDVARKSQELERLRHRQEDLEKQKRDLEELRQKQDDYARGKQEMVQRLAETIVTLEKQEIKATKLAEFLGDSRKKFKAMRGELEEMNDETWPEESFREELGKALVTIDDTRMEFNKTMARIDAIGSEGQTSVPAHDPVIFQPAQLHEEEHRGFVYWLMVGLAVSLPVMVMLAIIFALALVLVRQGIL